MRKKNPTIKCKISKGKIITVTTPETPHTLNNFKFLYTNTHNSLLCKIDELKGVLSTENVLVAAATEIKPKNGAIPPRESLQLKDYDCFLNPAYENQDTRGVVLYTKSHLNAQPFSCIESDRYKDSVWVKIPGVNNTSVLVGTIYRSGTKDKAILSDTELHAMLKHMCLKSGIKCVMVMGDFNHNGINWTPEPVITTNHRSETHPEYLFVNTLTECFLHQHVSNPTRERDGQTPTIDDLILSTDKDMISNL